MAIENFEQEGPKAAHDIYKCPSCGSNLSFDPGTQSLKCAYCGYEEALVGTYSEEEHDFANADFSKWNHKEAHQARCQNCGANVIIDPNVLSVNCPFCDTPMVISTDEITGLKPDRVIPFTITDKVAQENYRKWLKKRVMAPHKVKKEIPNPTMNSVYVPTWTFDSFVSAKYEGRLGKRYTKTTGNGKTVTEIKYFSIGGTVTRREDDCLVCSGEKMNQQELSKIEPFHTNESFVYDNRYLSGHTTEHYSMELKDGWKVAQGIIEKHLEAQILAQYDNDVVDYLHIHPKYDDITYKYVILPVWLCRYLYNRKSFRFVVNGETGKVSGKFPISPVKVGIIAFFILAAIAFIIWAWLTYGD